VTVTHANFTLERTYDVAPARVYAAWSDPAAKARWFGDPSSPAPDYALDFRVGGTEHNSGGDYSYDATYQDIVPGERIVYTYDMHLREQRISVSLSTVEFLADGTGTRLVYTEQGAFLDGLDEPAAREHGTGDLLDALGRLLKSG
jgi:uncharacterized protein YndB with AHSA1/START domain